jgi:AcrR family transcriptional regulator
MLPKRDENRRSQRERILDAARGLFASRGFEAVTMREIAEQAGVVRATVFNHFGSKGALVEAITESVLDVWAGMLERALADETTSTPTLVRALFDQMGFGIEQFHGFYRGVFREMMKIQVGLDEGGLAVRASDRARERLARLLARGQQRGDLSRELELADLLNAFMSLANGTIVHWLYEEASGSLRERMRSAADILLGPIASGVRRDEPLPNFLPEPAEAPNVKPLARRPRRRTR